MENINKKILLLKGSLEKLLKAGGESSNICYNLSQCPGKLLTSRDCQSMKSAQIDWDAEKSTVKSLLNEIASEAWEKTATKGEVIKKLKEKFAEAQRDNQNNLKRLIVKKKEDETKVSYLRFRKSIQIGKNRFAGITARGAVVNLYCWRGYVCVSPWSQASQKEL